MFTSKIYGVHNTIFYDQTGQFPTQSQQVRKHIMIMVEIDINASLVELMKSQKDAKMIRMYRSLILRLQRAGITPTKHVLDN